MRCCDICASPKGQLIECPKCKVPFHFECYNAIDEGEECLACQAVGKTYQTRKRDPVSKKRIQILVSDRPTECALCSQEAHKLHLMYPLYDDYGQTGRILVYKKTTPLQTVWAHALCALHLTASYNVLYGCNNRGGYDYVNGDDVSDDGAPDEERDGLESVNPELNRDQESPFIHHFVYTTYKRNDPQNAYTRAIKDMRKRGSCVYCHDNGEYRIPVSCYCGREATCDVQIYCRSKKDCQLAMHVGCARWAPRKVEPANLRRCFYQVEQAAASLYCDEHAKVIYDEGYPESLDLDIPTGSQKSLEQDLTPSAVPQKTKPPAKKKAKITVPRKITTAPNEATAAPITVKRNSPPYLQVRDEIALALSEQNPVQQRKLIQRIEKTICAKFSTTPEDASLLVKKARNDALLGLYRGDLTDIATEDHLPTAEMMNDVVSHLSAVEDPDGRRALFKEQKIAWKKKFNGKDFKPAWRALRGVCQKRFAPNKVDNEPKDGKGSKQSVPAKSTEKQREKDRAGDTLMNGNDDDITAPETQVPSRRKSAEDIPVAQTLDIDEGGAEEVEDEPFEWSFLIWGDGYDAQRVQRHFENWDTIDDIEDEV